MNIHEDIGLEGAECEEAEKKAANTDGWVPVRGRATGIPKCHVMPDYGLSFFSHQRVAVVVVRFFRAQDFFFAACSARVVPLFVSICITSKSICSH